MKHTQFGKCLLMMLALAPAYSLAEYAYIYNTSPQAVAQDDPMIWGYNGILSSGIQHTTNTGDITFLNDGVYAITIAATDVDYAILGIYLNGTFVAGTNYESVNHFIQLETIIEASANDVLSVRAMVAYVPLYFTSGVCTSIKIHSVN